MKKHLLFAATALALAACSNNDDMMNNGPVAAQITAGVSAPGTRAVNNQWEADDIGVMVTDAPASDMEERYKNVKYTTSSATQGAATFISGNGIYFQDASETVTFAAYGPYRETAITELPGTDGVIAGLSTEKQSTREKQKEFDYIYASGATASRSNAVVEFKKVDDNNNHAFRHKMTRLVIVVRTSATDGFGATEVTKGTYTLNGLSHDGTFNVTTGEAKATGAAAADSEWSLTANSLLTPDETEQCTFTSILYPQTLGQALVFKATVGGQTYTNNTDIQPGLQAGMSYTYTITVKKTGLTVSGCTIENWSDEAGKDGDAVML